ncbi:uncharacterized protein FOMMEDRAFT_165350 [Fomitiporia mediterranea MF3/22]|uniref:uncharacterized protein n=1 Tax=Fomitiporia mediterranea (strain MF3/22) TaxID=694068 RepID=UPI00044092C2|nr:uncharacterized protein FOMMEDRAFT_165350 [Fomitiporia mediterranea MF3/22]EJD06593.1 hypothetical protein FOMMEDRAFT_165350 [Fomitiporia mediterranea MF3/22]
MLSIYEFNEDKNIWLAKPFAIAKDAPPAPSLVQILTWNVDFMEQGVDERLECVLEHVQYDVFKCPNHEAPAPCVILLQEVKADALIDVLLCNEWVRSHFHVTPASNEDDWPYSSYYGNITLVAKGIPVAAVSSLDFANSIMGRTALMVDVLLTPRGTPDTNTDIVGGDGASGALKIRIANVHLESLPLGAAMRPQQLKLVADALQEPGLDGGFVCGDMNAITEREQEKNYSKEVGLDDAYVGANNDGHTWGNYQTEYPPGRLDKVLYTPGRNLTVENPQRIGVGLKTKDGLWASDHYADLSDIIRPRQFHTLAQATVQNGFEVFPQSLLGAKRQVFEHDSGFHKRQPLIPFRLASIFALAAAIGVSAQQLHIDTPSNVVQCLPQLLTWGGGTGPWFVSVLPGGQPGAAALIDFGQQSGTQLTWVVNIAAGTSIGLTVRDQTGATAESAPFNIGSSSDSSCVGQPISTVSGSSTGAATGASTASGGATTTGSSSGSTTSGGSNSATGTTTRPSSTGSGTGTASGAATSSSGAARPFAEIGSAGLIGAVIAAIFV